jgi:hypothetical protein
MEGAMNYQPNYPPNTLFLKSGKVIEFEGLLRNHLMTDDLHICVLERGHKKALVTFNEEGEILWSKLLINGHNSSMTCGMSHWRSGGIEKEEDHIIVNGSERLNPYSGERL